MTKIKIQPGDLVKLKWNHPESTTWYRMEAVRKFEKGGAYINLDDWPLSGEDYNFGFLFADAIRNEDCLRYRPSDQPIMYLRRIDKENTEGDKRSYQVYQFLLGKSLYYTILVKNRCLEDYFYPVQSGQEFEPEPRVFDQEGGDYDD